MQTHEQVFNNIFNRQLNNEGNIPFLQKITEQYPYFAPAHFYLLKLTNPKAEEYKKLASTASVFFSNPYWLNLQLATGNEQQTTLPAVTFSMEGGNNEAISTNQQPQANNDELLFEPLHITDYFASQGIKISTEINPADELGKQLKSFTEWLKVMKKLSTKKIEELPVTGAETEVLAIAEKSNTGEEVLTETMAEVYLRQGKYQKAIETYQKLSLLNPSKSAYFAALIDKIKGV